MKNRLSRSPSSSPSLPPVDSSPPSSPCLTVVRTPPDSPGPKDPFAGSMKSVRQPRIYERNGSRKSLSDIGAFEDHHDVLTRPDPSDATPTHPTRVVDPFSGSAKRNWRPPAYERKDATHALNAIASTSSSPSPSRVQSHCYASPTPAHGGITAALDDPDEFHLTDDEAIHQSLPARSTSKRVSEHELWDTQITAAIEKLNGVIDLRYVICCFCTTYMDPRVKPTRLSSVFLSHRLTPWQVYTLEKRTMLTRGPDCVPRRDTHT